MLFAAAAISADRAPVTIVLSEDYPKILNEGVVEQLSDAITNPHLPVIVLMSGQVTFNGWDEIRGLLDKIGCLNVRYFAFSKRIRR
jgi:hypothetical protein